MCNVSKALKSYRSLMAVLCELTEEELVESLRIERANSRRKRVLERLVKRLNRVRSRQEHARARMY